MTTTHRLERALRRLGVYGPLHRASYGLRSWWLRTFRPEMTVTVAGISRRFGTPTPTHARWIGEIMGEREPLERFLAALRPGDVVWDVGAHVGLYALLAAARVGESGYVFAFEPEPRTFAELGANIARNEATNITALPLAIGAADGQATLYTDWRAGLGVHKLFPEARLRPEGESVPVRAGDALLAEGAARPPAAIKLDVEGWEGEALAGMRTTLASPTCRLLLLEVHLSNLAALGQDPADLRLLLEAAGLAVTWEDERVTYHESGAPARQAHWLAERR